MLSRDENARNHGFRRGEPGEGAGPARDADTGGNKQQLVINHRNMKNSRRH